LSKLAKMLRTPPAAPVIATAPFPGPDQRIGLDRRQHSQPVPYPDRRAGDRRKAP
jgi:hypothetical protein